MLDTRQEPVVATKECSMIYTNRSECFSLKPDTRRKEQRNIKEFSVSITIKITLSHL